MPGQGLNLYRYQSFYSPQYYVIGAIIMPILQMGKPRPSREVQNVSQVTQVVTCKPALSGRLCKSTLSYGKWQGQRGALRTEKGLW